MNEPFVSLWRGDDLNLNHIKHGSTLKKGTPAQSFWLTLDANGWITGHSLQWAVV